MIEIGNDSLKLSIHEPDPTGGHYRGTRFDWAGIFDCISYKGRNYTEQWYEHHCPTTHDAVCGPTEEFTPIGFEDGSDVRTEGGSKVRGKGDEVHGNGDENEISNDDISERVNEDGSHYGGFLKIGVGILKRPDPLPYDRFRLYEILDPGTRETIVNQDSVTFIHRLGHSDRTNCSDYPKCTDQHNRHDRPNSSDYPKCTDQHNCHDCPDCSDYLKCTDHHNRLDCHDCGYGYIYEKTIEITSSDSMCIKHRLTNCADRPLSAEVYNHNFFTLGLLSTGTSRKVDFPFQPQGHWRVPYSEVGFSDRGIRFSKNLVIGESVFCGDIKPSEGAASSDFNAFTISDSESKMSVEMRCDAKISHAVFWANHKIACVEPYIPFNIRKNELFEFKIDYIFSLLP